MISNNNMGSHNKLEKLEEKKKLELQLLKINYDLSSNEITRKKNEKVIIDDKNIKEIEEELKIVDAELNYNSKKILEGHL